MKKVLFVLFIITLAIFSFLMYKYYNKEEISNYLDNIENIQFYVDKYTIFGTHLNISACTDTKLDGDLSLVLKNNDEEIVLESIFDSNENTCFKTSNYNNEGIYLDNLKVGNFSFLVKEVKDEQVKYYSLENKTSYKDLTYYTITRNNSNNKIDIKFNKYNDINYLNIDVSKTTLPNNVYDITIDPGHGGRDPGASYKLNGTVYNESDFTLKLALLIKKDLEDLGLKVKLTRESDIALSNYGSDGRAVVPNKVNSKYSISVHINSSAYTVGYGGVEVYTPNDINYELARLFASNISEVDGYSKNPDYKIEDGVYFKYFKQRDIDEVNKEMREKGWKEYQIKVGTPYMFMIREIGGINTHAYLDGRNIDHGVNEFANSNKTAEPYLIEFGYINYKKDLENLLERPEAFATAVSNAMKEYLKLG